VITISCLFSGTGLILLSRITNVWQLYVCFGIVAIGGTGFLIPIVAAVAKWFVKRRGMMTSIVISAHGTCEMIVPPLSGWLIATQGWRNSYLILGSCVVVIILIAVQFIRRDPGQKGLSPYGGAEVQPGDQSAMLKGYSLREALRIKEFWILGILLFCLFFGHSFIYTHIVIHATGLGIPRLSAVTIISIIGAMYIVSLNVSGNVADRIGKRPVIITGFFLVSLVFLGLLAAKELWTFYLLAFLFGLGRGAVIAPMPLLVADIFGLKSLGVITGAIFFGLTASMMMGPIITGYIFDVSGSYFMAMVCCGIISLIGLLLAFLVKTPKR
jgi:MFS family permease